MPYVSKRGRRPDEYASKSSHVHVIRDPSVQEFLANCILPKQADQVDLDEHCAILFQPVTPNPIHHIIAIDGGYTEVPVRIEFPSATICFFQIGALIFSVADLDTLDETPFIDPEDISKLRQIQRLKFTLPVRNITLNGETSFRKSVRQAIHTFFRQSLDDMLLIDTLKWFVFEEYAAQLDEWMLATCPLCDSTHIPLKRAAMTRDYSFVCPKCRGEILLTDVFRLHEAIDEELGAGGVLGYVITTVEQMVLVHLIRLILRTKPSLLQHILFIKDGPLAFFGQTANMHKPMRQLVNFLFDHYDLNLAGLEKTGPFVEHADEISSRLKEGSILILDNDYIYKYIVPGKADPSNPYGRTTYYGNKVIFKTPTQRMHVITLPTRQILTHPQEGDFYNLQVILTNVEKLKCDMYDDALIPVAMVNKLVSLANHPSARILQKFAISSIQR